MRGKIRGCVWNRRDKLFRFVMCGITTFWVFSFRISIMVKHTPHSKLQFIMVISLFMHNGQQYYCFVPNMPCILVLALFQTRIAIYADWFNGYRIATR